MRQQKHRIVALLKLLGTGAADKAGYEDLVQQSTGLALVPALYPDIIRGWKPGSRNVCAPAPRVVARGRASPRQQGREEQREGTDATRGSRGRPSPPRAGHVWARHGQRRHRPWCLRHVGAQRW